MRTRTLATVLWFAIAVAAVVSRLAWSSVDQPSATDVSAVAEQVLPEGTDLAPADTQDASGGGGLGNRQAFVDVVGPRVGRDDLQGAEDRLTDLGWDGVRVVEDRGEPEVRARKGNRVVHVDGRRLSLFPAQPVLVAALTVGGALAGGLLGLVRVRTRRRLPSSPRRDRWSLAVSAGFLPLALALAATFPLTLVPPAEPHEPYALWVVGVTLLFSPVWLALAAAIAAGVLVANRRKGQPAYPGPAGGG